MSYHGVHQLFILDTLNYVDVRFVLHCLRVLSVFIQLFNALIALLKVTILFLLTSYSSTNETFND